MCLTCGCMDAHREMGEANITYEDVERAAKENGNSVLATFELIVERPRRIDPSTRASTRPSVRDACRGARRGASRSAVPPSRRRRPG